MCGASVMECTVSRWFSFMGTYNEDVGVPFHIEFVPIAASPYNQQSLDTLSTPAARSIQPPSTRVHVCSEAAHPGEKCQIASIDCMLILSLFGFGGLCFAVLFLAAMHYGLKKGPDNDLSDFKPAAGTLDDTDLGTIDTLGSWIESQLELICAHYGQLCAKRPLTVFTFGMLTALLCSSGLFFVRFTTDPVELWSSRTSRARSEKTFFDSKFG
ncbi:unnamed protein product [Gongylonema pulchrum]|uniref:NPC1_N domain-containing protein n=1 Tax=Gongylonema pulchrum TaxID=637853 RepID=A0A183ELZ4_9BILA|nr:unnamed protein product [Gongylonema pulchrum]